MRESQRGGPSLRRPGGMKDPARQEHAEPHNASDAAVSSQRPARCKDPYGCWGRFDLIVKDASVVGQGRGHQGSYHCKCKFRRAGMSCLECQNTTTHKKITTAPASGRILGRKLLSLEELASDPTSSSASALRFKLPTSPRRSASDCI